MQTNKGFTLIELLVVVLIIGILSAVALPQYQKAVTKSRMTQLSTAVNSIAQAEQRFFLANDTYTADRDNLDIEFAGSEETFPTQKYSLKIKNGACGLEGVFNTSVYPWVYCHLTTTPSILLGYRLKTRVKICCNYTPSNALGNKLCQQETQTTTPTESSGWRECYNGTW